MCFDDFDNDYEEELFDEQGEESWQDDNVFDDNIFDLNEHDAASREVEFFEKKHESRDMEKVFVMGSMIAGNAYEESLDLRIEKKENRRQRKPEKWLPG